MAQWYNATVVDDAIRFVTSNANVNSNFSNIHGTRIYVQAQAQGQEECGGNLTTDVDE